MCLQWVKQLQTMVKPGRASSKFMLHTTLDTSTITSFPCWRPQLCPSRGLWEESWGGAAKTEEGGEVHKAVKRHEPECLLRCQHWRDSHPHWNHTQCHPEGPDRWVRPAHLKINTQDTHKNIWAHFLDAYLSCGQGLNHKILLNSRLDLICGNRNSVISSSSGLPRLLTSFQ